MTKSLTIPKKKPSNPALNFELLREEGIKHIAELAGKYWTDYNTHDPGITILEVLCYALTDLGYRSNMDIKNLLALPTDLGYEVRDAVFGAAEVFSCHPVTLNDYRKLTIDQDGVRNAWFFKDTPFSPVLYFLPRKDDVKLLKYGEIVPNTPGGWIEESLEMGIIHIQRIITITGGNPEDPDDNYFVDLWYPFMPYDDAMETVLEQYRAGDFDWDDLDLKVNVSQGQASSIASIPTDEGPLSPLWDFNCQISRVPGFATNHQFTVKVVCSLRDKHGAVVSYPALRQQVRALLADYGSDSVGKEAIDKYLESVVLTDGFLSAILELEGENDPTIFDTINASLPVAGVTRVFQDPLDDINLNIIGVELNVSGFTFGNWEFTISINVPEWEVASQEWLDNHSTISQLKLVENEVKYNSEPKGFTVTCHFERNGTTDVFPAFKLFIRLIENIDIRYSTDALVLKTAMRDMLFGSSLTPVNQAMIEAHLAKMRKAKEIIRGVKGQLHRNRNLCQDFKKVSKLKHQEVVVCADLIVKDTADSDLVVSRVYEVIDRFVSPQPTFQSLNQLLDKQTPIETIYDGPLLVNGFLTEDTLSKSEGQDTLYASDLVNAILSEGIPELLAIKGLRFDLYLQNERQYVRKPKECLHLLDLKKYRPRLGIDKSILHPLYESSIITYGDKGSISLDFDFPVVRNALATYRESLSKGAALETILKKPKGKHLPFDSYTSIQHHFPATYRLGKNKVESSASKLRKAQSRQLQGYLLVFEQILANYLSQLSDLPNLFSLEHISSTMGSNPLYQVPDADHLLAHFTTHSTNSFLFDDMVKLDAELGAVLEQRWTTFKDQKNNDYIKLLRSLESHPKFADQRNNFLNHLLARFGEAFTDYAMMGFAFDSKTNPSNQPILNTKISALRDIPLISGQRFRAFSYGSFSNSDEAFNQSTENVAGFERRLYSLLGIHAKHFRNLTDYINTCGTTQEVSLGQWTWSIDLVSGFSLNDGLFYASRADAESILEQVLASAGNELRYVLLKRNNGMLYFELVDSSPTPIVLYTSHDFAFETKRAEFIAQIFERIETSGFYVLEHHLLRPQRIEFPASTGLSPAQNNFFIRPVWRNGKVEEADYNPYSFRITVVVPAYLPQYQTEAAKSYLERIVRTETPAHIWVDIVWVKDDADFEMFESAFHEWRRLLVLQKPTNWVDLRIHENALFDAADAVVWMVNKFRAWINSY